jgi:hypothetical protein
MITVFSVVVSAGATSAVVHVVTSAVVHVATCAKPVRLTVLGISASEPVKALTSSAIATATVHNKNTPNRREENFFIFSKNKI